jgi:hypothetical protein
MKRFTAFAGHCFSGALPDRGDTDEHCFQWVYGSKAMSRTARR